MSFNCSSLTQKDIKIINYIHDFENNYILLLGVILIINGFIQDTTYGYTPLYILYREFSEFMRSHNQTLTLIIMFVVSGMISNYMPVLNTFVVITSVLQIIRLNNQGPVVWLK
jgi:hypothetical protein